MWRVAVKRSSSQSSFSVEGASLSPDEPPRKRMKITSSSERTDSGRNFGVKGVLLGALNGFIGGFRRVFNWRRSHHQPDTTQLVEPNNTSDSEYLQLKARMLNKQKGVPRPLLTSTPSQYPPCLNPVTPVVSSDLLAMSQAIPSTSISSVDRSDGAMFPRPQPSNDQSRDLKTHPCINEGQSSQVAEGGALEKNDEDQPLTEMHKVGSGRPLREAHVAARSVCLGRPLQVSDNQHSGGGGRQSSSGKMTSVGKRLELSKEDSRQNSFPQSSATYSSVMRSTYTAGRNTSTNQNARSISACGGATLSLFTPVLMSTSPEVIGPSLSFRSSSRNMKRTENSLLSDSFEVTASTRNHSVRTSADFVFSKAPVTLSPVSLSPPPTKLPSSAYKDSRTQLTRDGGGTFLGHDGERGVLMRGQSAPQSCPRETQYPLRAQGSSIRRATREFDTQQIRDVQSLLERIKLDHARCVEDRKIMAELIEKKIHLHQNERMAFEDARNSRQRRQLSSTSTDEERGEREPRKEAESLAHLSNDQIDKVCVAVGSGLASECLSQKYNIRITRSDLRTLDGLQWLNDEVINFYFNMIKERSLNKESTKRVHVFNTFFYPKLSQTGYSGVRRWTKKVDIFEYDMVLVPVHMGMHWCLAAVDFGSKCVSYYDSLHGNNNACLRRLREYINDESKDKKGVEIDLTDWTSSTPKDIPYQMNGSDCGVFSCMYARFLAVSSPFLFSQEDMPKIREHMIAEILEQKLF